MKQFQFSLEPVLKLKARRALEARTRLARATAELVGLNRRSELLAEASAWADREAGSDSSASGLAKAYFASLVQARVGVAREISRASAQRTQARDDWIRAHGEERTLERLREIRLEAHRAELATAEQAQLEELAMMRKAHDGVAR